MDNASVTNKNVHQLLDIISHLTNTIQDYRYYIEVLQGQLKTTPTPLIWNGTLNDLTALIDTLTANNYLNTNDSELAKLFLFNNRQITAKQLQRTRSRLNDYKDPDYKPSEQMQLILNEKISK